MKLKPCLAVPAFLLLTGCIEITDEVYDPRTESESVELGGAEMVRAEFKMPAGELKVAGGGAKLLEAEFTYNTPSLKPEVAYNVTGFRGRLTIDVPGRKRTISSNLINRWNLRLSDDVPVDLHVTLGAGKCNLNLAGLSLRSVEVEMGAGNLDLDLTGDWERNFEVTVRGGVGEATVLVPRDVGVIAKAGGGLGNVSARGLSKRGDHYVNSAYDESPITIQLDIKGGIGEIKLIAAD